MSQITLNVAGWENFVQWIGSCWGDEARQGLHISLFHYQSEKPEMRKCLFCITTKLLVCWNCCPAQNRTEEWYKILENLVFFLLKDDCPQMLSIQELEDPLILIHEKKISSINAVVKVLELALKVSNFLVY